MMNLYHYIQQLHESQLYRDLKYLASMVLTIADSSVESEVITPSQRYHILVYWGDAFFHTKEYAKAEDVYRKALQFKKALNKAKGRTNMLLSQDTGITDLEIKYRIYKCLYETRAYKEAMNMLESISSKQRTAKINVALAKLYVRFDMDRSAITSYKEVLRECPLAIEAIMDLLSLGVKGADVASLVMNGLPQGINLDWLFTWIKANAFLASKDYTSAISTFKHMDSKAYLKDSIHLLSKLGEAKFYDGQYVQAKQSFQRVHAMDPSYVKNMDLYSYLLAKDKQSVELQGLFQKLMAATETAPESWIAAGYYAFFIKRPLKTVYFSQKASNFDQRCIQSYLLKGAALLELKKRHDAILHFQEAIRLAPHRYEAYQGLIECYLASTRAREALTWASTAIKTLGSTSRTLTLYASVLAKEPTMTGKAKPYLEKAMKLDPNNLEPVYLMAEILAQEQQYDKGIELLRKQLQNHSTCRLHHMLAEALIKVNDHQEALDQFSISLGLDPTNVRAKEGIERIERLNDAGLDGSNYVDMEDMDGSDNDEAEYDGSDVDSMGTWSDADFS